MTTAHSEPKTYREKLDEVRAGYPTCCPNCHDDSNFSPTFVGKTWDCGTFGWVWEV